MGVKGDCTMNIGEVLSKAWKIIWKHKVLWIFGILAGCSGGGGGGGGNSVFSYQERAPSDIQPFFDQFANIPGWLIALIVAGIVILIFLLVVLVIFLGTVGRIGLIQGTQQVEQGAERLSFGEVFRGSLPYFWRVFGLNLLFGLAVFLVIIILGVAFLIFTVFTIGFGALCIFPLICVLIPVGWLVGVYLEQVNLAMVIENLGIPAGVQRGWEVFRNNLGTMIIMGLILYLGVSLIGSLVIALPFGLIVVPVLIGVMAGTDVAQMSSFLLAAICFIAYLPVLILLNGVLRAYIESAWTLTYLHLTGKTVAIEEAPAPLGESQG
jgi:hypothetical protein